MAKANAKKKAAANAKKAAANAKKALTEEVESTATETEKVENETEIVEPKVGVLHTHAHARTLLPPCPSLPHANNLNTHTHAGRFARSDPTGCQKESTGLRSLPLH